MLPESLDSGAVYTLALKTHIGMSIDTWKYFAGWCDKIVGSTIPIAHARPNSNFTFTKREPIGWVKIHFIVTSYFGSEYHSIKNNILILLLIATNEWSQFNSKFTPRFFFSRHELSLGSRVPKTQDALRKSNFYFIIILFIKKLLISGSVVSLRPGTTPLWCYPGKWPPVWLLATL